MIRPFDMNDFWLTTLDLSDAEIAAYMRLLAYQSYHGFVPVHERSRAHLMRCRGDKAARIWSEISRFFELREEGYVDPRFEHYAAKRSGLPTARRAHRVREASGWASDAAIAARRELYGNRCWMCGADAQAMDHVKPIAAGGSNWPANLRPACKPCNSRKGAKWPYEPERAGA